MSNPFEVIEARLSNIEALLLEIKHASPFPSKQPEPDGWLNLDELCSYLPSKPSKATVYGWTQAKKIPYHKTGKSLAFRKSEVDGWLSASRIKTTAEIDKEATNYLRGRA